MWRLVLDSRTNQSIFDRGIWLLVWRLLLPSDFNGVWFQHISNKLGTFLTSYWVTQHGICKSKRPCKKSWILPEYNLMREVGVPPRAIRESCQVWTKPRRPGWRREQNSEPIHVLRQWCVNFILRDVENGNDFSSHYRSNLCGNGQTWDGGLAMPIGNGQMGQTSCWPNAEDAGTQLEKRRMSVGIPETYTNEVRAIL